MNIFLFDGVIFGKVEDGMLVVGVGDLWSGNVRDVWWCVIVCKFVGVCCCIYVIFGSNESCYVI